MKKKNEKRLNITISEETHPMICRQYSQEDAKEIMVNRLIAQGLTMETATEADAYATLNTLENELKEMFN